MMYFLLCKENGRHYHMGGGGKPGTCIDGVNIVVENVTPQEIRLRVE